MGYDYEDVYYDDVSDSERPRASIDCAFFDRLTHHTVLLLLLRLLTHLLSELLLLHLLLHCHLLVLLHWIHHGPALAAVPSDPHGAGTRTRPPS